MYHSPRLEKVLLGKLIMSPDKCSMVDRSIFYIEEHKKIFDIIKDLYANRGEVEFNVLSSILSDELSISISDCASLLEGVPSGTTSAVKAIIEQLREYKRKRSFYVASLQIQQSLKDNDVEQIPDILEKVKAECGEKDILSMSASEIVNSFKEYLKKGSGVKIGIPSFDKLTDGLAGGEVMYLLARAGVGKSVFMQNALRYFAINYPTDGAVLFSLEMSAPQLGERMLMIESEKTKDELKEMTDEEKEEIITRHKNVYYITRSFLSLTDIYSTLVKIKYKSNVRLVVIDFLTRIKTLIKTEYDSLRVATNFIKDMAKELDVAIIVLAQTGREQGGGGFKPLRMESGRGSGTIEEDADFVFGLYAPDRDPYLNEGDKMNWKDILIFQSLKTRRTPPLDTIQLYFNKKNLRLIEMER